MLLAATSACFGESDVSAQSKVESPAFELYSGDFLVGGDH
jgi:hypothetical protein